MSGLKNILFSDKPGKPLEVDICAVPGWDGFDKLIQFLKNEYSVEIINCIDGPDARRWTLKAEGQEFELRHEDPYGNSLVAPTSASESIVRKIALDLEKRLAHLR
ncbi:MAG: hypothetical protein D6694_10850 [Gammaproteobacteria bacterium]|nr:MAG: hypothetical protein D6694_10850 [Gammaproteobacteria bacterium]